MHAILFIQYTYVLTALVVSLEKSEYTEAEGDNFTVTIALNDEASEDFIVVVNVTDETAIGRFIMHTLLHSFLKYLSVEQIMVL